MRKIVSWIAGFSIGAALAGLLIMIFVPETGAQITARLKAGYDETMEAAREAAEKRRAELEAELATLQKRRQPAPPEPARRRRGRR